MVGHTPSVFCLFFGEDLQLSSDMCKKIRKKYSMV